MSYNLLTLPVTLFLINNGLFHLWHSLQLKKRFPKDHDLITSISTFLLWVFGGLLYPILYPSGKMFLFLQLLSNIVILILTPTIIFLMFRLQHSILKKKPGLKKQRGIENFIKRFESEEKRLKKTGKDIRRKALHTLPPLIIFFLLFISTILNNKDFGIALILTVGCSAAIIVAAIDFVRLSFIYGNKRLDHLLPSTFSNVFEKGLKKEEMYESLKVVPLILGLIPALFLRLSMFLSVALISTIGDGAASVFGHLMGKVNFPKKSNKTITGYIAGATASFAITFIIVLLLEPLLSLSKTVILSAVGMITFFLIDIFSTRIDDNILNPLLTTLSLGVTSLLIF